MTGRSGEVRVVVAGCGRWGRNYARVLQQMDGCRLAALCDVDTGRLAQMRLAPDDCVKTTNLKEAIRLSRADAVVVAAPAGAHCGAVLQALDCGMDVLVEKPMAVSRLEAEKMVSAARRARRILMVGHILQFHGAFNHLARLIDHGELGNLRYVHSIRTNLGPIREDVNVFWDLGSHDISMMLTLAKDEPVEVTASGQSYLQRGVPDVAFGTIYFRRRRVMGHIHVSWLDPQKVRRLTVIGTKRMSIFDDMNSQEPLRVLDRGVERDKSYGDFGQFQLLLRDGDIRVPHVTYEEPLRAECAHFVQCVRGRARPTSDGEHGLKVVQVLEAFDKSCRGGGRPVKVRT